MGFVAASSEEFNVVDHVIPPVAVRQWVISVPKRFRGMLAPPPSPSSA